MSDAAHAEGEGGDAGPLQGHRPVPFALRLVCQSKTVAEHIRRNRAHVQWINIVATIEPGMGARTLIERE